MGKTAGTGDRLMTGGHLRRSVETQVTLFGETLDEVVEKLGELVLGILVTVSAQRLEQLGCELAALNQCVENRLLQRFERPVCILVEISPWVELASAREPGLQQKVCELSQQRLQIDGIGHLGAEARVGMRPHAEQYSPHLWCV